MWYFNILVSSTKYSLQVKCKYAEPANYKLEEHIISAKQRIGRLPKCKVEIRSLEEALKLAKRKLVLCKRLVLEV